MATIYTIECVSGEYTVEIEITDSIIILPGSDTWTCKDNEWGLDSGNVSSWDGDATYLGGIGAGIYAELSDFGKDTKAGDSGFGEKHADDGDFPPGKFEWTCTGVA